MSILQAPPNHPEIPPQNGQPPNPIETALANLEYQMKATREGVSELENKLNLVMSPANLPPPSYEGTPSLEEESPAEFALKNLNLEIEGIRQYINQIKDRVRL